jgi:hypothetical protein
MVKNKKQPAFFIVWFGAIVIVSTCYFVFNTQGKKIIQAGLPVRGEVASTDSEKIEEIQSPSYYTIFRFITDYLPFKEGNKSLE